MRATQIIKEIERLPIKKRMLIVEKTVKSIRENESKVKMTIAVDALLDNYVNDLAFTEFTSLDLEDFYAANSVFPIKQ